MRTKPYRPLATFALCLFTVGAFGVVENVAAADEPTADAAQLVIHGGAGTLLRDEMSAELEAEYRAKLGEALVRGHSILAAGGTSLDAVEATIQLLEDSPLFNAGRGSVFTAEGRNEMDASIMEGHTRDAGAVASVTNLRSPIAAARAVMEHSPHVMLSGPGAEAFATSQGLESVTANELWTERRWKALQKRREKEGLSRLPEDTIPQSHGATAPSPESPFEVPTFAADEKFGTVGAVALDSNGHLAAGTSTGGMTFKRHGRIGDSPIIGAGTYADDLCGVSSTGHGEYFIRWAVAHEICALVRHRGLSPVAAAEEVIHKTLKPAGGNGGVIVLSSTGEPALVFNTPGMYRGSIGADGVPHVAIYGDE